MNYKQTLKKYQNKSIDIQIQGKTEIIEAFRDFWKSNPTEKDFYKYTNGLVLFPEMIYIMVKK